MEYLTREQLVDQHDDRFRTVPLGDIQEARTALNNDDIEAILPELVLAMQENYEPVNERHRLFFGSRFEKTTALMAMVRTGAFSVEDMNFVTSYLEDWIEGLKPKAPVQPPQNGIMERLPAADRTEYVAGVLMPLSLEILFIFDNADIEDQAKQTLDEEGVAASAESIRLQEHKLAIEALKEAKADQWWKQIYAKRQILETGAQLERKMELDMEDMFGLTGRRQVTRKVKNYRE